MNVHLKIGDVAVKTMKTVVLTSRLHQWAAPGLLSCCMHVCGRQYSVGRPYAADSERARLLTSFYYQGAIDKAATKVCKLHCAVFAVDFNILYVEIWNVLLAVMMMIW